VDVPAVDEPEPGQARLRIVGQHPELAQLVVQQVPVSPVDGLVQPVALELAQVGVPPVLVEVVQLAAGAGEPGAPQPEASFGGEAHPVLPRVHLLFGEPLGVVEPVVRHPLREREVRGFDRPVNSHARGYRGVGFR
jgi:hypothetical protein